MIARWKRLRGVGRARAAGSPADRSSVVAAALRHNGGMADDRVAAVREELDRGGASARSLVLLSNAATDARHDGDVPTLEQTLALARRVAEAEPRFRADAEQLVAICEQALVAVVEGSRSRVPDAIACPECGNDVSASALRCRRCGHLFL